MLIVDVVPLNHADVLLSNVHKLQINATFPIITNNITNGLQKQDFLP
jgi:hypothetical protein